MGVDLIVRISLSYIYIISYAIEIISYEHRVLQIYGKYFSHCDGVLSRKLDNSRSLLGHKVTELAITRSQTNFVYFLRR